jgi:hypothetical protein
MSQPFVIGPDLAQCGEAVSNQGVGTEKEEQEEKRQEVKPREIAELSR